MTDIKKVSKLIDGIQRTIDLSTGNVVVGSITVGGLTGPLLDQSTLNNLIAIRTDLESLGAHAFFTGQIAGMTTDVTLTATNPGTTGNSISLPFNGSTTINFAISTWNTAHPTDLVALTSGIGT